MTKKMSEIPKELLEEILARVPVQSMGAVRLTCKQWKTLSEEESFTKKHLIQVKAAAREFMVVMVMDCNFCLMSIDLHGIHKGRDVEPSIECKGKLINLIDTFDQVYHCGGLLASITQGYTSLSTRLVVWNPYRGQTRWIETSIDMYAIGYEMRKSCRSYKILIGNLGLDANKYQVYELDSNSWKVLHVASDWATGVYRDDGVSVNGNTYWYTPPERRMTEYVISFDFTTERFGPALPLPFRSQSEDVVLLASVREEQLAVLFVHWYAFEMEIWITTTIDPNDVSWRKLFVAVDMKPLIGLLSKRTLRWSFFVDEEMKAAVLFDIDKENLKTTRNIAYIIGENGYFRSVDLGESARRHCFPVGCSYVPSSVQIKKLPKGKSS